jgi:hypothetical protein
MLKLNLYNASQEFGVSRETLRKQLLALEFVGPEFTIQQVCKAVFNDLEAERTRNAKEDADIWKPAQRHSRSMFGMRRV